MKWRVIDYSKVNVFTDGYKLPLDSPSKPKIELNQDAVLALRTLGVPANEAKRQILEAMGMFPNASIEKLVTECLKPKGKTE